jgi:4-amino-4-deoxy-L-arabinose transferase-like glycosyltransferase
MTIASAVDGAAGLNRLLDALSDPKRSGRTVAIVLVLYCAIWTLYAVLAKLSQDIHFDMGEMVSWSREIGLGTPKHPPLSAWLVGIWFSVFPLQTWAYYLFSMTMATLALWVAWMITARYLDGEKRAAGLALLTLVPFFNFHALKYNANSAMTPAWALTTWFFLRSLESRSAGAAVVAGLAAAAAMLVKYWSVVLLAGLGIAAVTDSRRGLYFRSPAPYITVAVGAAALAPHIWWLYAHDFAAFGYALESHPASVAEALLSGIAYVASAAGYVAVPVLIAAAATRPSGVAVADTLWPVDPPRRTVVVAFVLPLLLTLSRPAAVRILAIAIAVPVVCVVAAPVVSLVVHLNGVANHGAHYRLVARDVEKVWRETTDRPLHIVGGSANLLYGSLFYFAERPSIYEIVSPQLTPWVDEARIAREGIALYCPAEDFVCMRALNARAARSVVGKRVEVDISRTFLGIADTPARYVIVTIPPV